MIKQLKQTPIERINLITDPQNYQSHIGYSGSWQQLQYWSVETGESWVLSKSAYIIKQCLIHKLFK